MSKSSHPRALADTEAQAIVSNLRVSPRKLNLVAGLIRNLPAQQAVAKAAPRADGIRFHRGASRPRATRHAPTSGRMI